MIFRDKKYKSLFWWKQTHVLFIQSLLFKVMQYFYLCVHLNMCTHAQIYTVYRPSAFAVVSCVNSLVSVSVRVRRVCMHGVLHLCVYKTFPRGREYYDWTNCEYYYATLRDRTASVVILRRKTRRGAFFLRRRHPFQLEFETFITSLNHSLSIAHVEQHANTFVCKHATCTIIAIVYNNRYS